MLKPQQEQKREPPRALHVRVFALLRPEKAKLPTARCFRVYPTMLATQMQQTTT